VSKPKTKRRKGRTACQFDTLLCNGRGLIHSTVLSNTCSNAYVPKTSTFLSPHGMRRYVLYGFFVGHAVNDIDEIWQVRMNCTSGPRLVNFGPTGPGLGRQNTEGCKNVCNAFLVHGLAERDEIGGFRALQANGKWTLLRRIWRTLAYFSAGKYCDSGYLAELLPERRKIWHC